MKPFYDTKRFLKLIRRQFRRAAAARRWGRETLQRMPAVLGNAMPKAGSHLIIQVLLGLPEFAPFVNPGFPPVNRYEDNSRLPEPKMLANITRMQPGDISYGYVHARPPFLGALTAPGRATIFVYRDPRDLIISHVFYATDIHKTHELREYYREKLDNMPSRIDATIRGIQDPSAPLADIRWQYENFLPWLEQPDVLCLRFEELILARTAAFNRLLDYLAQRGYTPQIERAQALAALERAIDPKKSGTFRKAQPGNWQQHFTEANKAALKEIAGDILIRLGYEKDNDW